jgi:hypothetical protein
MTSPGDEAAQSMRVAGAGGEGEGMLGGQGPQGSALATGCQQEWGKGVELCRICVLSHKDDQPVLVHGEGPSR